MEGICGHQPADTFPLSPPQAARKLAHSLILLLLYERMIGKKGHVFRPLGEAERWILQKLDECPGSGYQPSKKIGPVRCQRINTCIRETAHRAQGIDGPDA